MLSTSTKMNVYKACVLSTLLYGSEVWVTYTHQERRLITFHLRCLRRILGITLQAHTPNKDVLQRASTQSVFGLLSQRRMRWLGHVYRMEDGRIPKDVLYGELVNGTCRQTNPSRYKDLGKLDLKASAMDTATWEVVASDRSEWRPTVEAGVKSEPRRVEPWQTKREDQASKYSEKPLFTVGLKSNN